VIKGESWAGQSGHASGGQVAFRVATDDHVRVCETAFRALGDSSLTIADRLIEVTNECNGNINKPII
jgi:hypothetical protein